MIAVIFEFTPGSGRKQDYLDLAAGLSAATEVAEYFGKWVPRSTSLGAEPVAEQLREIDFLEAGCPLPVPGLPARAGARPGGRGFEGAAIAVVQLALARVVQNIISRLHLLELFLGRLIVRVHVGVILARQPAVGLLNVSLRRVAFDPQDLIIIVGHGECFFNR
jgi:hypothetical protein